MGGNNFRYSWVEFGVKLITNQKVVIIRVIKARNDEFALKVIKKEKKKYKVGLCELWVMKSEHTLHNSNRERFLLLS